MIDILVAVTAITLSAHMVTDHLGWVELLRPWGALGGKEGREMGAAYRVCRRLAYFASSQSRHRQIGGGLKERRSSKMWQVERREDEEGGELACCAWRVCSLELEKMRD